MSRYLDLDGWKRRQHFEFFKGFDNPFFNICVNLDVTNLLGLTRSDASVSFFIAYHFLSMRAANEVEPFRYRLRDEGVLVHDRIHAGTTFLLADETFTFVYFDYAEEFEVFQKSAREMIEKAKSGKSRLDEREDRDDLIHHSVLPWVSFNSISHARNWGRPDSIPKIAFGKYRADNERVLMPISVEVHHALMDGLHVGRYFEKLARSFADPRPALNL
jgi:chloramphenicol O-acetyltransferase type A